VLLASCFALRTSENTSSETVWKIGIGPESGLRKRPRVVEGVSISHPLPQKKHGREAFSYFPNSFSTHLSESSSTV
jgi:hypothetical protein